MLSSLEDPPETVPVSLYWGASPAPVRLNLPFPATGGRFFDGQGRELQAGARLSPSQLTGARLRIFDFNPDQPKAYSLQLSLRDRHGLGAIVDTDSREIKLEGAKAEVRLIDHVDDIVAMLGMSDVLDAVVVVTLIVGAAPGPHILVTRYDGHFELVDGMVALRGGAIGWASTTDARLAVCLASLSQPDVPAVELAIIEEPERSETRWLMPAILPGSGPWFAYPSQGSSLRLRPLLVTGEDTDDSEDEASASGLRAAMAEPDPFVRARLFDSVLASLAGDFGAPEWGDIELLWERFGHLPLPSLDLWRRVVANPEVLCAVAMRAWTSLTSSAVSDVCLRFSDELGALWEEIPLATWEGAVTRLRAQWTRAVGDERAEAAFSIDLGTKVEQMTTRIPSLNTLLHYLLKERGLLANEDDWLVPGRGMLRSLSDALWGRDNSALQTQLLREHPNDQWPEQLAVRVFNDLIRRDGQTLRPHLTTIFWTTVDYKTSVANAPVLLAYYTCRNLPMGVWKASEGVRGLRRHRKFDRQWFELAYDYGVKMCIAAGLAGGCGGDQPARVVR